jgi:hypothetical protein
MNTRVEIKPELSRKVAFFATARGLSLTAACNLAIYEFLRQPENTVTPPPSAIKSAPVKTSASTDWDDDT